MQGYLLKAKRGVQPEKWQVGANRANSDPFWEGKGGWWPALSSPGPWWPRGRADHHPEPSQSHGLRVL